MRQKSTKLKNSKCDKTQQLQMWQTLDCDSSDSSDSSDNSDQRYVLLHQTTFFSPINFFHHKKIHQTNFSPKQSKCDKLQKLKLWQNSQTQNGTKLKNSKTQHVTKLKTQNVTKLKIQIFYQSHKLKEQENSKTQNVTKLKI